VFLCPILNDPPLVRRIQPSIFRTPIHRSILIGSYHVRRYIRAAFPPRFLTTSPHVLPFLLVVLQDPPIRRRDSSVVWQWATGGVNDSSSPGRGWEFFFSPPRPDRLWGPPSLLYNGYEGLSLWLKRPGREAVHSSQSSVEVKNAWNYKSNSPIRLHGVVLS
jgi:hypothetical protein